MTAGYSGTPLPAKLGIRTGSLVLLINAPELPALAPLPALIDYAGKLIENGAVGVFSHGQAQQAELTDSRLTDRFSITALASRTSPEARILIVKRWPDAV